MEFKIIWKSSRAVCIELVDEGIVYTDHYTVFIDGEPMLTSDRVVQSIYGLKPDTEYRLTLSRGDQSSAEMMFKTEPEFVTLNVRDFGARGDDAHNDTLAIQAAILSCPPHSRVYVPEGIYKVSSLFMKSGIVFELGKGAVLSAYTDRTYFPILPGLVQSYDETSEYNLASWEGNPLDSFASIITGIGVSDVTICGEGTIEGNATYENWWEGEGRKKTGGAFRPRSIFLNRCKDVTIQGISIKNSPAWTVHPYFSENIRILDISLNNPKVSPNTDGIDPESVKNLEIVGVHFSLGDDCIAIKSGKRYMGHAYVTPSENIEIRQCHMKYGHGSVTLGSEISAGVRNLYCHDCIFEDTDRGLRIKTRRGRGKESIIDNIRFENIRMDGVLTPFVLNSFYWCCDPDGKSEYVRCKDPLPVDDRTPTVGRISFKNIEAQNCHVAATFMYGLPEAKVEELSFENVHISFAEDPKPDYPAMMADVEPCTRKGAFIRNCKKLVLKEVQIEGADGDAFDLDGIDLLER